MFNREATHASQAMKSISELEGSLVTDVGMLSLYTAVEPDVRSGFSRTTFRSQVYSSQELQKPVLVHFDRNLRVNTSSMECNASLSNGEVHTAPDLDFSQCQGALFGGVHSVAWRGQFGGVAALAAEALNSIVVAEAVHLGITDSRSCAS